MSVLECSRKGCGNIMCNRHSSVYGYICKECFNELVSLGLDVDIRKFMASNKNQQCCTDDAFSYYNDVFEDFGMEQL